MSLSKFYFSQPLAANRSIEGTPPWYVEISDPLGCHENVFLSMSMLQHSQCPTTTGRTCSGHGQCAMPREPATCGRASGLMRRAP